MAQRTIGGAKGSIERLSGRQTAIAVVTRVGVYGALSLGTQVCLAQTVETTVERFQTLLSSSSEPTLSSSEPAALPEAPEPQQAATASVSGTVLDVSGAVVPRATVTLVTRDVSSQHVLESDGNGDFLFGALPPGVYKVTIVASGLETFISNDIRLVPGERFRLPTIAMPPAATSTDVTVTATTEEVAAAQLQLQEKQRVFGVLPNFYTSYIWNAAPMNRKQKLQLSYKSLTDPVIFMTTAAFAGVEQAHNTFPGYGGGFTGYASRYGAAYGDTVTSRLLGNFLFPALFHQDPRYFYRGTGSVKTRAWYAVSRTVVTRRDNGDAQFNYSRLLGSFAAAGLSNLYRAPEDRRPGLTIRNGFIITGSQVVNNLLREFVLKKLTPNVPDTSQGKPADGK